MPRLDGKMMESKLKIGWTTSDFAQRFMMTEGDFVTLYRRLFGQNPSMI